MIDAQTAFRPIDPPETGLAASSTAAQPPSTIMSASETLFPPDCALLNSVWILSSFCITSRSSAGLLTAQSFCGARRIRAPFAPPRLSVPRNVAAEAQAAAIREVAADEASADTDRADLAELETRRALLDDAARPEAMAKIHGRGRRTARENLADLVDEGSFQEYGSFMYAAQKGRRDVRDLIENTPGDG